MNPIAVYVHIPFCPSKCGYCDFNSYAMDGEIVQRTVRSTIEQIRRSPLRGRPAKTIFFGGGTPTFIPVEDLISIFEAVQEAHSPLPDAEITSEANPGTVDSQKFSAMIKAGFNRISLGGQSFSDDDLLRLGRIHKSGEIERAVEAAKEAGFTNINLDLMFGLSGQNLAGWRHNLKRALGLELQHLSLYCLTIEPNTSYFRLAAKGQLPLPDEEAQVEMYNLCLQEIKTSGFIQYEISNFARPGRECRHNLEYWFGREYAGYGPGAVGSYTLGGKRFRGTCLKHPLRYSEAIERGENVIFDLEDLDQATLRVEEIMLGIRLNQGISAELSSRRLEIKKLLDRGWISSSEGRIRLTESGRHFCSEVTLALI